MQKLYTPNWMVHNSSSPSWEHERSWPSRESGGPKEPRDVNVRGAWLGLSEWLASEEATRNSRHWDSVTVIVGYGSLPRNTHVLLSSPYSPFVRSPLPQPHPTFFTDNSLSSSLFLVSLMFITKSISQVKFSHHFFLYV